MPLILDDDTAAELMMVLRDINTGLWAYDGGYQKCVSCDAVNEIGEPERHEETCSVKIARRLLEKIGGEK